MKVALCFYGLVGSKVGKSMEKKGDRDEVLENCYESVKEHIIDKNDVDVFFHTWDIEFEKKLVEKYNPKLYKVQKQKIFKEVIKGPKDRVQAHYSRWYSAREVNKLKLQYEEENNFRYDLVLSTRFDIFWTIDVLFKDFKKDTIYIPGVRKGGSNWGWPYSQSSTSIADHWFFGGNTVMDKMSTLYDKMNYYMQHQGCPRGPHGISNHMLALHHLKKLDLIDEGKVKTAFHMVKGKANKNKPNDFQLYRSFFI